MTTAAANGFTNGALADRTPFLRRSDPAAEIPRSELARRRLFDAGAERPATGHRRRKGLVGTEDSRYLLISDPALPPIARWLLSGAPLNA